MAKGKNKRYVQRFRNGSEKYVAYGTNPKRMRVYEPLPTSHRRTKMHFPNCLKFMPYAVAIGKQEMMSKSQIVKEFGPFAKVREA